jgi:hypothetical protein
MSIPTVEPDRIFALARSVAAVLADDPAVVAVALGGSRGGLGLGPDARSDIDLEVYTRADVPMTTRRAAVAASGGAVREELGNAWWGAADEWVTHDAIHLDLAFFDHVWMEDRLASVLQRHEPTLGYTTCFWHTVRSCHPLEDRVGWLAAQRTRAAAPYPDGLRRRIIEYNHPVLRAVLPAYREQLANAIERGDLVSINHRLAGLLASYCDIVFAVNRQTHPGEKRLIAAMTDLCPRRPDLMAEDLDDLLRTATSDPSGLLPRLDRLLDRLDTLLRAEGFGIAGPPPRGTS